MKPQKRNIFGAIALAVCGLYACSEEVVEVKEAPVDKVEAERLLGQLLFHERRMSKDNTVSCAACHLPNLAFTDGVAKSQGIEGRTAFRNSPTLMNMKDQQLFMFDGVIESLEMQALAPIQDHNEMGSSIEEILSKLKEDKVFKAQVHKAYGRDLDAKAITQALAAYQRTLVSADSRYELSLNDPTSHPLSTEEEFGKSLFFDKFKCVSCHSTPHFTNGQPESNGLLLTKEDWGRYRATGKIEDKGKFKVPSLRNIEITGPYMHDGRFNSLEEVLAFYAGKKQEHGDVRVRNLSISKDEQLAIIAFLKTLTDKEFMK